VFSYFKNMGPGAFVAAAFIGPGTVTVCTLAGANFGYALMWALVFATVATMILQEMSARLGVITQKGLGETLRITFENTIWKWPLLALMVVALYVGNAAYEGGNLSGAALGIEAITGKSENSYNTAIAIIIAIAAFFLWKGNYKQLEKLLIGLISLMAVSFVAAFFLVNPDFGAMAKGIAVPTTPAGSLTLVIALIGTTVVPYNLFLHASTVKAHWSGPTDLKKARTDNAISIGLGGLIMLAIAGTAAASIYGSGLNITGAGDMAVQLEPVFGPFAKYMLGIGFFAAGISSAITAPLATGYAISEITGNDSDVTSKKFRMISLSVLVVGGSLALTGIKPLTLIISAQFANGLLLPIIATFLLIAMNSKGLLGDYVNGKVANIMGGAVILITTGLGAKSILKTFGIDVETIFSWFI
jgi:NRAMP (natural resistance-associated macrophage protein)-like metal ion transporter